MVGKWRRAGPHDGMSTMHMAIIAIVIVLVVVAAALITLGKSGNAGAQPGTGTGTVTTTLPARGQQPLDPASIVVPTTVSIAKSGIFIHVQYLGSYNGSYTADGEVHAIRTSGDRLFSVENSSQAIRVSVQKTDRSAKQPMTVDIWKDGNLVTSSSTTDLFGQVNVTAVV